MFTHQSPIYNSLILVLEAAKSSTSVHSDPSPVVDHSKDMEIKI